jgi:hypothetical protein
MRKHKPVNQLYRWVHSEIGILYEIGRYKEGTIRNPRGYPEDVVIRALDKALEQEHQRRSEAAKKGAVYSQASSGQAYSRHSQGDHRRP